MALADQQFTSMIGYIDMTHGSWILGYFFDRLELSQGGAVCALSALAVVALWKLLISCQRHFASADTSALVIGFLRMLQNTTIIQLLALVAMLLTAILAEYQAWPSAGPIAGQSFAVMMYLLFSEWGARYREGETFVSWTPFALIVRAAVIVGGALFIVGQPASHTLALFMASTMALAAGFFFDDLKRL